jgi:hypothetical protein
MNSRLRCATAPSARSAALVPAAALEETLAAAEELLLPLFFEVDPAGASIDAAVILEVPAARLSLQVAGASIDAAVILEVPAARLSLQVSPSAAPRATAAAYPTLRPRGLGARPDGLLLLRSGRARATLRPGGPPRPGGLLPGSLLPPSRLLRLPPLVARALRLLVR